MISSTNFFQKSSVYVSIIGLSIFTGACKQGSLLEVQQDSDAGSVNYFGNYSMCYVTQYEDNWWNQEGVLASNSWGNIYTRSKEYNCKPGYQVVDCSTNSIITIDANLNIVWLDGGTSAMIESTEGATHCSTVSKWGYHDQQVAPPNALLFTDTTIVTCCI